MSAVVSGIGAAAGLFGALFQKKPKTPAPVLAPQRDVATDLADQQDLQAKRRGAAANLLLGSKGAESSAGTKTALGA